jgi:hypothetical protein
MNTEQLPWMIPLTLLIVASIQLLYLTWMAFTLRGEKKVNQPNSPIMPTTPEGMPTHHGGLSLGEVPSEPVGIGKIVILKGLAATTVTELPLPRNEFSIGRFYNPESNIMIALNEKSISRRHATFIGDEPTREYYLTDTNSSYGTHIQIDGRLHPVPPEKEQRIYNEDVVQFGNVVAVRFVLPCDTRPSGTKLY